VLVLQLQHDLLGRPRAVVDGEFDQITFPLDLQQYGQEALDAWLVRNTDRVRLLTNDAAEDVFRNLPNALRGREWSYVSSDGAAGTISHTWRSPANESLVIQFDNPDLVPPPANRHNLIKNVIFQPPA
jgi:hypothetical protein